MELLAEGRYSEAMEPMTAEDIPYLYWTAAGWLAAVSADALDFSLSVGVSQAVAMAIRAFELDPEYGDGTLHELFLAMYPSVPAHMMYRMGTVSREGSIAFRFEQYYKEM